MCGIIAMVTYPSEIATFFCLELGNSLLMQEMRFVRRPTSMSRLIKMLIFALLLIICSGDIVESEETTQDGTQPKEVNYKKFVGEKQFILPFITRIGQPFQEGQTVHAVGMVKAEPNRIDFNFHKGPDKNADMPLHLSMRFNEGKMVFNSYVGGNWSDNEQRIKNPFKANSEMDLRIRIISGKFKVFANRIEVGNFDQLIPLDGVDHVSISGDLSSLSLFHYGGRIFHIPYTAIAKVVPGKRLDISLMPTGKRFNINLYHANRQQALQISVRFNEGAVVRNAMENNAWGPEEREGVMPISKGEIVDITIINEKYSFQIFFNGIRFATFAHRGSPDDIETLMIDGECEIFSVTINNAVGV